MLYPDMVVKIESSLINILISLFCVHNIVYFDEAVDSKSQFV